MSEKEPGIEDEVIEALIEAWSKNPKMRLTQLIVNAIQPETSCPEIYYVEDRKLIKLLNKMV